MSKKEIRKIDYEKTANFYNLQFSTNEKKNLLTSLLHEEYKRQINYQKKFLSKDLENHIMKLGFLLFDLQNSKSINIIKNSKRGLKK